MTSEPAVIGVVAGIVWFTAFVLVHIVGSRMGCANARVLITAYPISLAGSVITGGAATIGSPVLSVGLCALVATLTSASLFVLYVPAVYTVLTSLSVQTIVWLRASGGGLPETALFQHFAGGAILDDRLATLQANGYIAREGEGFPLTLRGRRFATFFAFLKGFWRLGPGG